MNYLKTEALVIMRYYHCQKYIFNTIRLYSSFFGTCVAYSSKNEEFLHACISNFTK